MASASKFAVSLLLLTAPLSAGLCAVSNPDPERVDILDEVRVEGTRAALAGLRQEMVRLEDEFYERYNALNTNDLFDIHCAEEARTGTLLRRRYCRAVYEARAYETEGREHLLALQYQASNKQSLGKDMEWIAPHPPIVAIERRRNDFRRTMLKVTGDNPELIELLRQRAELAERYESLRREGAGSNPLPEE